MPAAIPAIIGIGGSIIGGLMGPKKTKQDTTTSQKQQQESHATFDPQQQAIRDQLAKMFGEQLSAGPEIPQWAQNAGRTSINQTFNSMLPRFESQLASRGFETSGKLGKAAESIEMGRGNAFQKLQSDLTSFAQQRYDSMRAFAQQFATQPTGSTGTATSTGTQNSVNTGPNPWQTIIPGITSDIAGLLYGAQSGGLAGAGSGSTHMSGGTYQP